MAQQAVYPEFSSGEYLRSIKHGDRHIEIVGYVDRIDVVQNVGPRKEHNRLKFFVNNGMGDRMQITAWNENIDKIKNIVTQYKIVHLIGVVFRYSDGKYNEGTLDHEVTVGSATTVIVF